MRNLNLVRPAIGIVLAAIVSGASIAEPVIAFPKDVIVDHRISGEDTVEVAGQDGGTLFGVSVRVTIAPDGSVLDARPDGDNFEAANAAPAVAAVRKWKFRPIDYRGKPVTAVGTVSVDYRPKGVWADRDAPFAAIDYATLKIELVRSACYGSCPDYRVTIAGDGTVVFSTRDAPADGVSGIHRQYSFGRGVLVQGVHKAKIDRATLDALIAKFRDARFFGLKKSYFYPVTDSSTQILRFSSGGKSMEVADYVGVPAGLPIDAKALEDAVDQSAGTARWVSGNAETVPALRGEGFDPISADATDLAVAALNQVGKRESDTVVIDLIAAGLPLDRAYTPGKRVAALPFGAWLLTEATRLGRPRIASAMIARGWAAKIDRKALSAAFAVGAGACDPEVARALVAAGADPMARTPAAEKDDYEAGERTALMTAMREDGLCRGYYAVTGDVTPMIAALTGLGVDINARDSKGQTLLYGIESPDLLEKLLAAGARADVKDAKGLSPVFSTWTDVIVLRLLEAGADPLGRDDEGTLRQAAKKHDMPATLAWLDAHGIK